MSTFSPITRENAAAPQCAKEDERGSQAGYRRLRLEDLIGWHSKLLATFTTSANSDCLSTKLNSSSGHIFAWSQTRFDPNSSKNSSLRDNNHRSPSGK